MKHFLKKHGKDFAYHSLVVTYELSNSPFFPSGDDSEKSLLPSSFQNHSSKYAQFEFMVTKRNQSDWETNDRFSENPFKNYGLWNHDVVEVFLQCRADEKDHYSSPYLELQVSPLNQSFALLIKKPREEFLPLKNLNFQHRSVVEGKTWKATLWLELPDELLEKEFLPSKELHLFGGFFSCLGRSPREFYSLEELPEGEVDFHRPELFLPLGQIWES